MELWSNVEKEKAAKQERAAARQPANKGAAAAAKPSVSRGDEQRLLLHAAGVSDIPVDGRLPSSRATDTGEDKLPAHSSSPVESTALTGHGREEEAGETEQQSAAGPVGGGPLMTGGPDTDKEQGGGGPATPGTAIAHLNHKDPGVAEERGATAGSGTPLLPAIVWILRRPSEQASMQAICPRGPTTVSGLCSSQLQGSHLVVCSS